MEKNRFIKNAGIMFFAGILANAFNLFFQLFMVRALSPVDFGVLNALLSLTIVISMPAGPMQAVVTKFIAAYKAHNHLGKIHAFLVLFFKKIFILGILFFLIILIFKTKIAGFFKIENSSLVIMLGIMMFFSALQPFNLGALQGLQKFKSLGIISIINSVLRFLLGVVMVYAGFRVFGALGAIISSGVIALIISFIPLRTYFFARYNKKIDLQEKELDLTAIYKYFLPAFIALPSFGLLTNMDIILVKHFFSPVEAGFYSVAQMIGKIILFLPGAVTIVMFPKVAENHTKNEETAHILKKCLLVVGLLCFCASVFCVIMPKFMLKMLSGAVHPECIPLIMPFAFSMTFFALDSVFLYYHLSVHNLKPIFIFLFAMLAQGLLIILFHNSLLQILYILMLCAVSIFFLNVFNIKRAVKA